MIALRIVASGIVIFAATAQPAVAADESFGAAISPSPLIVEHWREPAFSIENGGSVPVTIFVDLAGDSGYALASDRVELEPQAVARLPLVDIGEGEAVVRFRVTNGIEGMDRQAIVLETLVRHQTPWESVPWAAAAAVAALAAVIAATVQLRFVAIRRRRAAGVGERQVIA